MLRHDMLQAANRVLNRLSLHLLSVSQYNILRAVYEGPKHDVPQIPQAAREYLNWDNPALEALERRYTGHPAAAHSQWSKKQLRAGIDLARFRDDNHYVYQTRRSPGDAAYYMTACYMRDIDKLGLFGRLKEDGLFGAYTVEFENGYLISRDLLDSVNEANFIARALGLTRDDPLSVLDIGAGYGRLAHRLAEGLPRAHTTCTDAVPLSTFLCDFYLRFRGVDERTKVVPLDEAEKKLKGAHFDLVTNIHSFTECRLSAIAWWLDLLDGVDAGKMLIVPNLPDGFLSIERDWRRLDFLPLLARHGWRLVQSEPIYAGSEVAKRCALYPDARFHLLER